uniref:Uncharacterized protein n=1 Tax=Kalanchoe fedtschenkoi TaxID=63787 RepID=A0A7N0UEN0_KALFE
MQIMNNNHQHHHMLNNPYFMSHDNSSVDGAYRMWQRIAGYATAQKLPRGNWQWRYRRNAGAVKEAELLNTRKRHLRHGNVVSGTGVQNKLQFRNRRKSFELKKNKNGRRFAPYNTTSYIMRNKKAAGEAAARFSEPAVNPPLFSPSAEGLSGLAERDWGIDLYGSMKGLIRTRAHPDEPEVCESDVNGTSCTDLSKFEIIWPNSDNNMESEVEETVNNASRLENENLILKVRLSVMDRDMDDMKRRMQLLEKQLRVNINEEVKGNVSDDNAQSFRCGDYQEEHKSTNRCGYLNG